MVIQRYICTFLLFFCFSIFAYASDARVWVNSKSKVYHCEGARWYGKTKKGFFINEVNAISRGYRAANNNRCSSDGRAAVNDLANEEGANNRVWLNIGSYVYHCQGTRYYGNTKRGRFMSQAEAIKLGARPSNGKRCN